MGHWGAVLHITGLLPLQSKRFQQSAAAAIWEEGGEEEVLFLTFLTQPEVRFSARTLKINLLQIVASCHRYKPVPKSRINRELASTVNLESPRFTKLNHFVDTTAVKMSSERFHAEVGPDPGV